MANTPCPDFDLAPRMSWSPEILPNTGDDEVGSLALALSLAFNDFKDISWLHYQLGKCRPEVPSITAECGQWVGMNHFVMRRLVALMHEVFVAFSEAHARGLLGAPEWESAVEGMDPEVRENWDILVAAALERDDPVASALRSSLAAVRNSVADHYYNPKALRFGYSEHFHNQPRVGASEHAYVSLGDRLEGSRFYFADAAALRLFFRRFAAADHDPDHASFALFDDLVQVMNQGLRYFLEAFWSARQSRLTEEAGPGRQ